MRTCLKRSFLLGVDPVPEWARGDGRIVFLLAACDRDGIPRARKAFVETRAGSVLAEEGDRIALDRDGCLRVFPGGPQEAA